MFFNQFSLSEHCVHRSGFVTVGTMHDILLAGPVTPVDAVVDELMRGVGAAQMLKPHFVDVDGDDFFPVIPVYGKAEVGHVAEVGGAVDVIHLHPAAVRRWWCCGSPCADAPRE